MLTVALRIVNEVSYAMWINRKIRHVWQAQYLTKLEGDACFSAH